MVFPHKTETQGYHIFLLFLLRDVGAPSRTDIRDIFDQEANLDDHAYQNDFGGNEISTTGLFTRGGFGQRIFFKQNTALTDQMEHIESEKKFATSFLEGY